MKKNTITFKDCLKAFTTDQDKAIRPQETIDRFYEKLKDLDLNYFCADHYGYITGNEATEYIEKSIIAANARRASFEEAYLSSKDINIAANKVAEDFRNEHPDYIIPPEINRGVYRQMIRHIAQSIENGT